MPHRGLLAATALALVLTPVAATAAPGEGTPLPAQATAQATGQATGQAKGHGDRDHDGVDDAFGRELRDAKASHRFDVVVTGVDVTSARGLVGAFEVRRRLPIIDGFSATMTAGQARALAQQPGVRRVEKVTRLQALDPGTNADFGATAVPVDHPGVDGSGVGLCVVDTGVKPDHEQIAPRAVQFFDAINGATTAYDDHGHGTHVTSIAAGDGTGGVSAATYAGVAPAASLYAAKVLDSSGFGDNDQVVAGIQWCAAQPGVQVISMSLGDTIGGDGTDAPSLAVNAAAAAGDVVVVAAGNSGDLPGTINAPGTATGAITVGAVSEHSNPVGTERHDDGIWLATFSSRGPTVDGRTKPDVSAPGVSVTAAGAAPSGYDTLSGTSMATPYVAGAVVLAREAAPSASVDEIRSALVGTAADVGAPGTDSEYGAGLIDVRALVDQVSGVSPVRRTAFPTMSRVIGTVPDGGSLDIPIAVPADGLGVPLAVTMTITGQPICYFGCLFVEWDPDLDMELRSPSGQTLAVSECALSSLQCGAGRQETVAIRPSVAGTFVLRVYAWQGGNGAPIEVDISRGPLGGTATPPPPPPPPPANVAPTARAGSDRTVRTNKKTGLATFTLDGSLSTDSDGFLTSWSWRQGTTTVGSTPKVTLSRGIGTHVFVLTVMDDDGATGTDSVTITVRR